MATPTLRALRQLYPNAHVTALIRASLKPILDGCPWIDRVVTSRPRRTGQVAGKLEDSSVRRRRARKLASRHTVAEMLARDVRGQIRGQIRERAGIFDLVRRLGGKKFDTAVLLPNGFRWALVARMANIPRRIGYDRDGRGGLLTDRLLARRRDGQFVPVSTRDYYLGIARYLGAQDPDPTMQLVTRPEHDERCRQLLAQAGFRLGQPLVLINPGASYGEAKMWYPDRFAQVADRCVRELGACTAISGAPNESLIIAQVMAAAKLPILNLPALGFDLTLLKSAMKQSHLLITNDTGPRHIAAAFDVPVVTVFGPTDPAWSEIGFQMERQVMAHVYCRPCQKKRCPLQGTPDFHQCMTEISSDTVFERAAGLLRSEERLTLVIDPAC